MITIESLATAIKPERTVLLFGAGSSIPSGAPSSADLLNTLATSSRIDATDLDLRELSTVIESRDGRPAVIDTLRPLFKSLRPTGGLLTLPRFEWRSLYTFACKRP